MDVTVGEGCTVDVLPVTGISAVSSAASDRVAVTNTTWEGGVIGGLPEFHIQIPKSAIAHIPKRTAPPPKTARINPVLLVFFFGSVCIGGVAVIDGLGKLVNV